MINMLKNKQKTFNDLSLKTNYNRDTLNKAKNLKIQDKAEKEELTSGYGKWKGKECLRREQVDKKNLSVGGIPKRILGEKPR